MTLLTLKLSSKIIAVNNTGVISQPTHLWKNGMKSVEETCKQESDFSIIDIAAKDLEDLQEGLEKLQKTLEG